MKTKFTIILLLIVFISNSSFSQSDSIDYLGQTPPNDNPKIFAPGIVSASGRYEYGLSVSPDGNEIFFTCEQPGNGLMRIVKTGNTWSSPILANLRKINAWEFEAFYKNAGDTLFFTSKTSQSSGKDQFYFVIKNDTTWDNAQKLISPVNDNTVMWSSFAKNGNLYYTNEDDNNIYVSKYKNSEYATGTKINTGMHPYPAPDESFLLFDDNGSIYIRLKKMAVDGWHQPRLLNNLINTSSWEGNASLSPDGKYMFFARYDDSGNKSNIYWVSTSFIDKIKKENRPPYLYRQVSDTISLSDAQFSYTLPDSLFVDDDGNNTLSYSATLSNGNPLPTWLIFNAATKTFSGFPVKSGKFTIKIKAIDTANVSVTSTLNLKYTITANSIKNAADQNIQIFPNPAKNKINISFGSLQYNTAIVNLTDISGKLLSSGTYFNHSIATIDLINRPKGIYIVNLSIDGAMLNKMVIIE
jgi:hypothetical protein